MPDIFDQAAEGDVFDQAAAPQRHGLVDAFAGAASNAAKVVNEANAGFLNVLDKGAKRISDLTGLKSSGVFSQGAQAAQEGADYWAKKANESGMVPESIPGKVYGAIGGAPMGLTEFAAGPGYAAVKGAVNDGVQGAVTEGLKRFAVGKVFHGLEKANLSPVQRSGAMAGTLAAQTAAEGGSLQDVLTAGVTGLLLSAPGEGGKQSVVRQRMQSAGTAPEIAADLAGRSGGITPQGPGYVTAEHDPRVFSDTQGVAPIADSEYSPDFGRPAPPVLDAENAQYDNVNPAVRQGPHPDTASIEAARTRAEHPDWQQADVWQQAERDLLTHNQETLPPATDMSTVRPVEGQPIRQSEDAPGLAPRIPIGDQEPGQRFDGLDRLWDGKPAEPQLYNPEIPPAATDNAITRPVSEPVRPAEDAPGLQRGPVIADSENFNHDNLPTAAVTAADSLAVPPSVKAAVVGTPAEIKALSVAGQTAGKVVFQANGKAYVIDPAAAKEQFGNIAEAKRQIKAGGDSESAVLGYPSRPEGVPLETAAVTKTGEILTDPATIKQAATAGDVAYAAESTPEQLAPAVQRVSEAIKGGDINGEGNQNADTYAQGGQEGRQGLLDPEGAVQTAPPTLLHTASITLAAEQARDAIRSASVKILNTKVGTHISETIDQLARLVRPTARGFEAKRAGEIITEQMGRRERQAEAFVGELDRAVTDKASLLDKLQSSSRTLADAVFNKLPEQVRIDFMQRMDTGARQDTPQLQAVADAINKMFEHKVEQVRALGTGALENVRENYFPHMWERKGAETDIMAAISKRPLEGSKAFTKSRVFDDVAAGIAAGYKPISTNPMDLVLLKMGEMDKYITAHTALQNMAADGVAKLLPAGERAGNGWKEIDGRYGIRNGSGEHYVAQEEVAQVFNNYLSQSLYNNPYVGKIYQGYMGAANNLNLFQLGVGSAFHAGFTSGEAVISHVALGYKELAAGNFKQAAKYFAESPAAPVTNAMKGDKYIKALAGNGTDTSMAPILDMLEMSGAARMNQNARFFTNHTQNMFKNWADGRKGVSLAEAPMAAVEQMARPILEYLVPRHKYGVFAEMAEQYLRNNPNATNAELRTASQEIWNRVDSRLGQVVYNRLFMHNVAKSVLQGALRAPGWTGGTILEVGGGALDLADMMSGGSRQLSDRAAYVLSMATVTAITNGALTAAFTGEKPKGMDFIAFRDGGTDENGKATRFVLPTYAKDVYAYTQDWSKTLLDKAHPLIGLAHDLIKNKDYYGVQIADPEANAATRTGQRAMYTVKAFVPFWMRGAQKTWDREGGGEVVQQMNTADRTRVAARLLAPEVGVMPATSGYTSTALEKFVNENIPRMDSVTTPAESEHKKAINAMANQFGRLSRTGGDTNMIVNRAKEMLAAGKLTERDLKHMEEIISSPRLNRNFTKLPNAAALKAFNDYASDDERKAVLIEFGNKMDHWSENRPEEFTAHQAQIMQAVEHARRVAAQ